MKNVRVSLFLICFLTKISTEPNANNAIAQHYTLFPLSLGQILRTYSVSELHLTLNAGKWDYDHWGLPTDGEVATGGTFWAWIGEGGDMSIDEKWKGLRNALAGLFCSSLGRMDEIRTTAPPQPFAPQSFILPTKWTHHLRHATLPSENVCTENLTPFLKLLPCKGKSGLASLLNPHKLFDANWHGLGVHVTWDPPSSYSRIPELNDDEETDKGVVRVQLSFQAVLDPLRNPNVQRQDWSFESLFGRKVERSCPVAEDSRVTVSIPGEDDYTLSPEPFLFREVVERGGAQMPLNVGMSYRDPFDRLAVATKGPQGPVSIKRTLTEKSQLSGRLDVEIVNHHRQPIDIIYLETMPWIVQFYLHTLVPKISGVVRPDAISNITYTPSIPHGRPTTFQATFHIPANATLTFTMDITKAFLRYTEHPPDAQRGWDLPPAIVFVPLESWVSLSFPCPTYRRLYTPPLLITLATPDFSMPYNVIIFTCTVVAFVFASVFNLLTRRFVIVDMREKGGEE
ncbi:GPI transamidase component GPI16 [Coprinopsis sp. MPI-PUGE-AT-0042]|nr:GPI transamidase component GPI16 [Coprinopsis sp. MPI-PUGE-AT-0042]